MRDFAHWLHELIEQIALATAPVRPATLAAEGVGGNLLLFASNEPSGDPPKRTVRATRRSGSQTDASQRQTADAGTRDQGGGGGSAPPPSGGFRMPGGRRGGISWIAILVVLAVIFLPRLFGGGGGDDTGTTEPAAMPTLALEESGFQQDQGAAQQSAATPEAAASGQEPTAQAAAPIPTFPASTASAAAAASAASSTNSASTGDTWTIMLYQDADDQVLEQDIYIDLNEAELTGSTDNVQIVAQVDRFRGAYSGDGNWTSTKRFEVTRDRNLERLSSVEVADLGEANMADGQTLVDFIKWAVANYPADKYAIVLSDHGMGWPGGWSDPTSNVRGDRQFPLSNALGDMLYLHEIDAALQQARDDLGIEKFELIGMDACLMADVAVFTMLADHARYAVASQETEPALGWAYAAYLNELNRSPGESGAALGSAIVQTYIDNDERLGGNRANAARLEHGITLTAVDLSKMDTLNQALNSLSLALQSADEKGVLQARKYAQNFTNIFGQQVPPAYIDLGHFALLVAQASQNNPEVVSAVSALVDALSKSIVAEKSGEGKPGATGISIYFPNSQLYGSDMAGPASFDVAAADFAQKSLWDEYLRFFFTGREFQASADRFQPVSNTSVRDLAQRNATPGAGGVSLSPVTLSADSVAPGETVLLSADLSGENIGYIKFMVGQLDPQANSILWVDSDYLQFGETKELNGVYYPDWGEGDFTLEFEWEPFIRGISDGTTTAEALFSPVDYGLTVEDAVYTVDGLYTYADGTERPTTASFRGGELLQFFAFSSEGDSRGQFVGAPREIIPERGDSFTVYEQWVDINRDGSVAGTAYEEGKTVEAGEESLVWEELNLPPGDYVIGFVVEDLDGNQIAQYAPVKVTAQ